MMKFIHVVAICSLLIAALLPANHVAAQDKPLKASQMDDAIRDFLMRNPKVIREALAKAEVEEQVERTKQILKEQSDAIYRSGSPVIGPLSAPISIVEFFDYNCPYCRKTHPLVVAFLAANPDVRVVLKDIGNLGKESESVSRLVIATRGHEKAAAFHEALMTRQGRTNETAALDLARKLGMDAEQLRKQAATPETMRILTSARELANSLSVEGTPLFIIGYNGVAGAPDDLTMQLSKYVDEIRKVGCTVC